MMHERVITFGGVSGILTIAAEPRPVGVVFVNAGIVPRIGPHRLHVTLARAAAAMGVCAMRIDLRGLGESPPPPGNVDHEHAATEDIVAAADAFTRFVPDTDSVIIAGMCSGADHALRTQGLITSLAGLYLLDPYAYGSATARRDVLLAKVRDSSRWIRAVERLTRRPVPADETRPVDAFDNDRVAPPAAQFAQSLADAVSRGAHVHLRYTEFVQETLRRPAHFYAAFPSVDFGPRLSVEVDLRSDHTHTTMVAQRRLVHSFERFLVRAAGPGPASI